MMAARMTLLALALSLIGLAAQNNPAADLPAGTTDCSKLPSRALVSDCTEKYYQTRIVHLDHISQPNDANEILVAVRNMFDPALKVYYVADQNAIVIGAYPEELNKIEAFIHALDKPRRSYRLTFTIAESDGGKRLGVEHFSIIAVDGQHTTLKQGDKVPVATGSFSTENAASQTQFTYLDVGMNFDVTVTNVAGGVYLTSKVEQSAVGPSNTIAGVQEPVVRQTVLQGASFVALSKPLMLGSIDVPASTRHFDIDVAVEPLH
jgi:type II secretory pathway component GspD/PulD (secretin)